MHKFVMPSEQQICQFRKDNMKKYTEQKLGIIEMQTLKTIVLQHEENIVFFLPMSLAIIDHCTFYPAIVLHLAS